MAAGLFFCFFLPLDMRNKRVMRVKKKERKSISEYLSHAVITVLSCQPPRMRSHLHLCSAGGISVFGTAACVKRCVRVGECRNSGAGQV